MNNDQLYSPLSALHTLTKADIDKVRGIEGFPTRSEKDDDKGTAILSSFDCYTTFTFGGKTLTFHTCNGLEKYTKILKWDNGYLEVMAKYKQRPNEIEEYIDLDPILERLYMDKSFLSPIKKVRIVYA